MGDDPGDNAWCSSTPLSRPIGLIGRALGKDFLSLKRDPKATTYWVPVDPADRSREHYERQY